MSIGCKYSIIFLFCSCKNRISKNYLTAEIFSKQLLMNIIKKLQLNKIFTAFLLATILLITTACNSGDKLGARPNNLPVQLGGQNNPHKAGGDGMTQYKVPNDPEVTKGRDNASLPSSSNLLATANKRETTYPTDDKQLEGFLYSNSDNKAESLKSVDEFVDPQRQKALKDPGQIPAVKQTSINRSDPNNQLLEKTRQMFNEAADF
jgi:hypothetical protein